MIKSKIRLFISLFVVLLVSCHTDQNNDLKKIIDSIGHTKKLFAPDKRVVLFDIEANSNGTQIVLTGESSTETGLKHLLHSIDTATRADIINQITLLPNKELKDSVYALINNSVGNIRSKPSHSAELATQATLGTPVKILKRSDNQEWYLVQTPDRYISWIDHGALSITNKHGIEFWKNEKKVFFKALNGFAYENENLSAVVSDLVFGDILLLKNETKYFFEISYPDGRIGYVKKTEAILYDDWLQGDTKIDALISLANSMMGTPYLWGGTSSKGLDCSGFTKTVYMSSGLIIPRDASQQVNKGKLVDEIGNFDLLKKGDLLFFGKAKTDSTRERVVHVGLWLGDSKMIHASGNVHISSFSPEDPAYDPFNLNRYLKTKRYFGIDNSETMPTSLKEKDLYEIR